MGQGYLSFSTLLSESCSVVQNRTNNCAHELIPVVGGVSNGANRIGHSDPSKPTGRGFFRGNPPGLNGCNSPGIFCGQGIIYFPYMCNSRRGVEASNNPTYGPQISRKYSSGPNERLGHGAEIY
jgi:hypothetical protein